MPNMEINLSGVKWKNPVTTASGTFGSGREFEEYFDLNILGAITVKGVSLKPWPGNPPPRVVETFGGMLNSIGLQNPGVKDFIKDDIPFLRGYTAKIIVNVWGHKIEDYVAVIECLTEADVDMLELNISCPNIAEGGMVFGTDAKLTQDLVSRCKKAARQPLYVKLTPNVTSISEIAKAAEAAGADGLTLINTLLGMKIDINRKRPLLGNKMGGLSGPGIMPVAVRAVYQAYEAVKIPIIGMGGISSWEDAIEFFLAGARAVAVGTAGLINPMAAPAVIEGIEAYLIRHGYECIEDIVGLAHVV